MKNNNNKLIIKVIKIRKPKQNQATYSNKSRQKESTSNTYTRRLQTQNK
jgi:hypothetical protein